MEQAEILRRCDHTLLRQDATWEQIRQLCDEAVHYGCASVCIPPCFVAQAARYLAGAVPVCTVIGFPNGYSTTAVKCFEAATAVAECSTRKEPDSGDFLINYGSCAGRKNIPVGTVSLCNKLTQTVDGRTFYPDILYRHPFGEAELYSFPTVQDQKSFQQFLNKDAGAGNGEKGILVDMEAAAIYQAGNYYYAPHQMLFLKVVTDHGTTQEPQSAGSGEHFSQIMDRAAEEVLTFIRQLLTMQEKNSRQESMQEAFRSQVEEQAKLWQEALHGSETMKAQIRQMILYHSLCEEKEASGMQTMSGWYREYEQAGRLPAKDKREGKRILEELRARVL